MREAHVSAEQPEAQEASRLPSPHAYPGRSGGAQVPTPARPHAPLGLIRRVRDRATFAALGRAHRHVRGAISVRFVGGEAAEPAQLAYAVSGAPSAVVRNRVRRRLRAAVARAEPSVGGAYLVSARPEAMTMPFGELVDTLSDLFAAAGERA
ncbi:MAG TPA: ribonuclease P protein component [Candidatus Nitrosopolaris sp.]|nr:ribonuclease P protein component [Candidatus Nitrosopolaris sp.]